MFTLSEIDLIQIWKSWNLFQIFSLATAHCLYPTTAIAKNAILPTIQLFGQLILTSDVNSEISKSFQQNIWILVLYVSVRHIISMKTRPRSRTEPAYLPGLLILQKALKLNQINITCHNCKVYYSLFLMSKMTTKNQNKKS